MELFTVLLANGPNLNLLGEREPAVYGQDSLAAVEERLQDTALSYNCQLICFQTNHEGELLDFLHSWRQRAHGIILNPGAWTHTSVALRDCLAGIHLPTVEVHISHTAQRETFRHTSLVAAVCTAQIQGFGTFGYDLALTGILQLLEGNLDRE